MKNIILLFTLLIFCSSVSFAQKINFEKSLETAKQKSATQNKILFVKISLPTNSETSSYDKEIVFPDVVNKYNLNFISYEGNINDTLMTQILRKYSINKFPALLFFDKQGGLLVKDNGVYSQPAKYLDLANKAISLSKEKSIADFDAEYKKGGYDSDFLKKYIAKRMQLGITNNASLADQYVEFLKVSDFKNYDEVLFILKAGPLANGRAYKLAYLNNKIIDSIFKSENLTTRKAINSTIISNTMAYAISTKSIAWANAASNFTRTTWNSDYREGMKQSALQLLRYYKAVKDTSNYLRNATYYYDQHYMTVSKDSVEKKRIKNFEKVKNDAIEAAKQRGENITTFSQVSTVLDNIPTELNNAAFDIYLTGTKNPNYLNKAISWSKRSIEFEPVYGFYDTLAHLLYRLDYFAEAEYNQNLAIELAKTKQIDPKFLQAELQKMKNRTL